MQDVYSDAGLSAARTHLDLVTCWRCATFCCSQNEFSYTAMQHSRNPSIEWAYSKPMHEEVNHPLPLMIQVG